MDMIKKHLGVMATMALMVLFMLPLLVLAQEVAAPTPPPVPPETTELAEWVKQVFALFGDLKGYVAWQFKAVAIIYVVIGSFKVSALAPLWDKLGKFKSWVAPGLALVAALFVTWGSGPLSWSTAFIALTTGAGALALADILEGVKAIPGINQIWLTVIGFLEKFLKKPQQK